jgi:hypothetical protein
MKLTSESARNTKKGHVTRLLQGKNEETGVYTLTERMATKAVNRLKALRRKLGSWRAVGEKTGINFGTADAVANRKRKVTLDIVQKLGIQKPKRYYKNYRLREYYLARWVRRTANGKRDK